MVPSYQLYYASIAIVKDAFFINYKSKCMLTVTWCPLMEFSHQNNHPAPSMMRRSVVTPRKAAGSYTFPLQKGSIRV